MKQLKLDVSLREKTGTSSNNRLRKTGKVPAVVYGRSGSKSLTVDEKEFRMLMRSTKGAAALVEVTDNKGDMTLSVVENIQRHPYEDTFIHIDFHEVSADEEMHATLHLKIVGEAYGVKNESGVLSVPAHNIDVHCLPKDLPEFITVDVTELKVGQAVHIEHLTNIPGVTIHGAPDTVVVACVAPAKIEETPVAAEEAAEDAEAKEGAPAEEGEKKADEEKK